MIRAFASDFLMQQVITPFGAQNPMAEGAKKRSPLWGQYSPPDNPFQMFIQGPIARIEHVLHARFVSQTWSGSVFAQLAVRATGRLAVAANMCPAL